MKIEHIALWVEDLEFMRTFYLKYFDCTSNERYHNPNKQFSSYFIQFDNGCRLELMHHPKYKKQTTEEHLVLGYAHIAISLGSKEQVDSLTERFRNDGVLILGEPRTTGDGYYESVISDPEGNMIELTI
ncbi:glyoxalase/bleomycin resistance/extradiol dioxygenase family protein [bacterium]|nr:MAG: glyoxalase/bleomycin resistance/extradiol dioxygenase family protein [bacterium]